MDRFILDLVNTGIALFRLGESSFWKTIADIEKQLKSIKAEGEQDTSLQARQLRELLNKAIRDTQGLIQSTSSQYREFLFRYLSYLQAMNRDLERLINIQLQALNSKTGFEAKLETA